MEHNFATALKTPHMSAALLGHALPSSHYTSTSFWNSLRTVACGTLILGCLKNVLAIQFGKATRCNRENSGNNVCECALLMR